MTGWYFENGTSVSATDRLRAALPRRRRPGSIAPAATPENAGERSDHLREERVRLITDFIGEYSEDASERIRSNRALHQPLGQPFQWAG